jgi:hypothetical protein
METPHVISLKKLCPNDRDCKVSISHIKPFYSRVCDGRDVAEEKRALRKSAVTKEQQDAAAWTPEEEVSDWRNKPSELYTTIGDDEPDEEPLGADAFSTLPKAGKKNPPQAAAFADVVGQASTPKADVCLKKKRATRKKTPALVDASAETSAPLSESSEEEEPVTAAPLKEPSSADDWGIPFVNHTSRYGRKTKRLQLRPD